LGTLGPGIPWWNSTVPDPEQSVVDSLAVSNGSVYFGVEKGDGGFVYAYAPQVETGGDPQDIIEPSPEATEGGGC
jgi:hypothetical protein